MLSLVNQLPNSPTLKPKVSSMPFVQMEQIAAFLNIISKPPISLPAHDLFLTVDLFERKDPAQVVQCLIAFSRVANAISPQNFPIVIGVVKGMSSPGLSSNGKRDFNSGGSSTPSGYTSTSASTFSSLAPTAVQPMFPPTSPPPAVGFQSTYKKPPPPIIPSKSTNIAVSSWSNKADEKTSIPAWNIHQYGYMGGASQGSMGVSFGSRRQIVNTTPTVPKIRDEPTKMVDLEQKRNSLGEKEKAEALRRLKEEEEKRREEELRWQRLEEEEAKERERETARKQFALHEHEKRQAWQKEQADLREQELVKQKKQRDAAAQRNLDLQKAERERERAKLKKLEQELELARQRERQYLAEKELTDRELADKLLAEEGCPRQLKTQVGRDSDTERRFLQKAWNENQPSTLLTPLTTHKTGGIASPLNSKKSMPNFSTPWTGGAPTLIPQRTGGRVAQLTGEFNKLPITPLKTLTLGEYPSNGRLSPSPLTPHKTGDRRAMPTSPIPIHTKTGGDFPKPSSQPRALPSPPSKKPGLPPRDYSLPSKTPKSRNHTSQRTQSLESDFSTASTLRRQNSWEHDNETIIDVPTGRCSIPAVEEAEKPQVYKWANLSFLEREKERERERQREWERSQLAKEMKASSTLGAYRTPLMGPRSHR